MRIAYLVSQYPAASHTFIRREITALESLGVNVQRFTVRQWDQKLVDPRDQEEQRKARVVLHEGAFGLLRATLHTLFTRPAALFRTFALACRVGWRSDAGLAKHLIYVLEACVLRRWFAAAGIKHVHAHFGTNSTGRWALRSRRIHRPIATNTVRCLRAKNSPSQPTPMPSAVLIGCVLWLAHQFWRSTSVVAPVEPMWRYEPARSRKIGPWV